MEWKTYKTGGIKQKYVYRYLTLEKLVDFLETGELYLTRLDKFEDNLENISPYDINELKGRSGLTSKPKDANPGISDHHWEDLINNNRKELDVIREKLNRQQQHRFVSCWILNDVESFAMWDIYGKSGFAIRFDRIYLQKIIRESINIQAGDTKKIDLLVAGKVIYQNFDNMFSKEKESQIKYSVFRKHLSFNHESEFRIVGFIRTKLDRPGLRYRIPDLENLNFDIIANPRLNSFQFDQYKSILNKYSKEHQLKESTLKIWLEFRNTEYNIKTGHNTK